jgi:dephospho-CoA kinase
MPEAATRKEPARLVSRAPRLGLTGPIAAGKSSVAEQLAGYGALVLDADELAHRVLEPGGAEVEAVLAAFGGDLRRPDGGVDRAALARIVFNDPAALRRLEALVHPAVRRHLHQRLRAAHHGLPAAVLMVPLLFATEFLAEVDEVWVVRAPLEARRKRLLERHGGDEQEVQRRLGLRWPEGKGDVEVDNGGTPEELRSAIERAWQAFRGRWTAGL